MLRRILQRLRTWLLVNLTSVEVEIQDINNECGPYQIERINNITYCVPPNVET